MSFPEDGNYKIQNVYVGKYLAVDLNNKKIVLKVDSSDCNIQVWIDPIGILAISYHVSQWSLKNLKDNRSSSEVEIKSPVGDKGLAPEQVNGLVLFLFEADTITPSTRHINPSCTILLTRLLR